MMSKVIEPGPFLSDFDRQYLVDRGLNPDDYIVPITDENEDEVPPYPEWRKAELKAEVDRRNTLRAESGRDPIQPASDKNEDLILALEADDLESGEGDDDEDDA